MTHRLFLFLFACSFITMNSYTQNFDYFTDQRDGRQYKYVTIGDQTWMAENLRYISAEGSSIYFHGISDPDTVKNNDNWGRLYTFKTALEVCPEGWHLPLDEEWNVLSDFLGGELLAGSKMKTIGTTEDIGLWNPPNTDATNESGFSAVPGGYRNTEGYYTASDHYGVYWSTTAKGTYKIWCREFTYQYGDIRRFPKNSQHENSVRCIKD